MLKLTIIMIRKYYFYAESEQKLMWRLLLKPKMEERWLLWSRLSIYVSAFWSQKQLWWWWWWQWQFNCHNYDAEADYDYNVNIEYGDDGIVILILLMAICDVGQWAFRSEKLFLKLSCIKHITSHTPLIMGYSF